jgi:hypothetical protein
MKYFFQVRDFPDQSESRIYLYPCPAMSPRHRKGVVNMSVSNETMEFLAEISWYYCEYQPALKQRVERVEKLIAEVESDRRLNQLKRIKNGPSISASRAE